MKSPRTISSPSRRFVRAGSFALIGLAFLFGFGFATAMAGTAAGFSEYIIPFDEDIFAYVTDPVATGTIGNTNTTFTLISVTAWSDSVAVYYDHWENGYNFDPNNPDATADEKYTINQSQTLNFQSLAVPRPRTGADGNTYVGVGGDCTAQPTPATADIHNTVNYCYDGRDRIITVGGATTVTRGGYLNAPGPGKLAAIGEEVYPLSPQLVKYILPFGEIAGRADYQRVLAVIQATEDNTTIQIDFNGDGVYDSFNTENGYRTARADPLDATILTLNKGESYILDRDSDGVALGSATLNKGTVVLGSKTLQVEYFYGQSESNYNTRAVSAYPRGFWSKEYYAPAGSATGAQTEITLYNPDTVNSITITWETTSGTGTFTLAPTETGFFRNKSGTNIPVGSGVHFKGTGVFWGISDVDTNSTAYDWGYSLVPSYLLSDDQTVAWAPGNSPAVACNATDGRSTGLYLTPAQDNTTFFIDTNGDGAPETTTNNASIEVIRGTTVVAPSGAGYKVDRLQSIYITGSNSGTLASSTCDLTGARIYATGPFSMAFGENPDRASGAGGLDLGYTVLPSPENWMDLALTVDKTTSPSLVSTVAGATTVTYTLVAESHEFDLDAVSLVDTLPANWAFDNNSATITLPDLTTISGASANPTVSLPTLTWGSGLLGGMEPNQKITITFTAHTTAAFANGAVTENKVQAIATRTVGGVTQNFKANDFALNTYTDGSVGIAFTKTSSVPLATPVSPGDTLTYTLTVQNPATTSTTLTGISIYDPLPTGVTFVGGSGSVTCQVASNVRDEFASVAYSNNGPNNTANWLTDWSETDAYGGGAASGLVSVSGNALRFSYAPWTVEDNFASGNYTGSTGSAPWATDWVETNDNNSAANGFIRVSGGALQFRGTNTAPLQYIERTATVTGATAIGITYDWGGPNVGSDAIDGTGDAILVRWSKDGSTWNTLRTFRNDAAATGITHNIGWTPSDTTLYLRFEVSEALDSNNERATFDNVSISADVQNDAVGSAIVRTVNLTGATAPVLSFTTSSANLEANDTMVIEAATSAAGPFTTLATLSGGTPNVAGPYSLTPYISATTAIRFRVTGNYDVASEATTFDNVDISYRGSSTFASGPAPELLAASNPCSIEPNNSMTVTFDVTVDTPFPAASGAILNLASVTTTQIPLPETATAENFVLVPSVTGGSVGDRVWLDANGNGVFDAGESGLAGVEVTLKDQYGTPLQVTTTDSVGRYTFTGVPPGSGYYVEITSTVPAGLTQTTSTVSDQFNTNGVFTGSTGELSWLTDWTETGDNANATSGDIRIANNRIEFRDTAATVVANEDIRRSVNVAGATSITLTYDWAGPSAGSVNLAAGSDRILVQYSTDGTTWNTLRTINAAAAQTFTDTVPWTPTNNTFYVRYTNQDVLETNKLAAIDNVQVSFPIPNRTAAFDLAAGQDYSQADIGFKPSPSTSAIGDLVWVDADNDQVRDPGEPGLAGVTVELYEDTTGDGFPDGSPIATTVTDASGAYLFTGITADGVKDYVVTINTGQTALSGYSATTGVIYSIPNLPANTIRTDADFGFSSPSTRSIKDGIWLDNGAGLGGIAGNGVKDGAEVGIAGVTVELLNPSGVTIATTTTAADGTFQFTGVPSGVNYKWRVTDASTVLTNFFPTTPSATAGEFQMTGSLSTNLDYTAPSDVRHFGYNQSRSIGDTVFNDNGAGGGTLGNGAQDGAEPGLSGVTVLLYRDVNNDGIFQPGGADGAAYATQVTDANGKYLFSGLPTGSRWFVSIDQNQSALSGMTLTTAADYDGNAANGQQRQVTPALTGIAPNDNRLDIDYGYRAATPATISGRFFNDANNNGVDNAEAGIGGVTVELVNASNLVVGTATTASDGSYSFTGLVAGTYTVRVADADAVLAGYATTREKTETNVGPFNGLEVVTVAAAATVNDVSFGYYKAPPVVTQATVTSFLARDMGGSVAIEWETSSENGTVGFFLKRWNPEAREFETVNEKLLPSLLTPHGGVYRYVDRGAEPGRNYRYQLVEIEASGVRNRKGPYDVNTSVTAEIDAASLRTQSVEPDPRQTGYARAARVGRTRARNRGGSLVAARSASAKIGVSESGIHYVSLQNLTARGGLAFDRAGLASGRSPWALTNQGDPVSFTTAADGGLVFYGQGLDSIYAKDNVYWLAQSRQPGPRMRERRDVPSRAPSGAETFTRERHFEQDLAPAPGIFKRETDDFWLWDAVFSGDAPKTFAFQADGATGAGTASILVRLKGGSDTEADPDHHAVIRINGQEVGDALWNGLDVVERTFEFDASLLVDGENALELEALSDTAAPYSLVYLDSFDLSYESRYRAAGNRAEVLTGANRSILISGFTRPDILVLDVTDPLDPVRVTGRVVDTGAGTFGVALAPRSRGTAYVAAAGDALSAPSDVRPDVASSLKSASNRADYVILTTKDLAETANTLAAYRSDLASKVVDIEDVYDEFNFGIADPHAVRSFLARAFTRWSKKPKYVVLAGDGTWDYKDNLGMGNALPPMMIETPQGLFPSDVWFADVDTRGAAPEMAIGRLPVSTPEEFAQVIAKIQTREAMAGESWMNSALMLTDDPDAAGDFVAGSDAIAASLPAGVTATTISLPALGLEETRSRLINGINGGAGIVNYIGHGGYNVLADEGILWNEDSDYLTNVDRLPVMTAMTCLVGNFGLPWIPSLGETLVRKGGGGVAAIWAPTGMSENDHAVTLAENFYASARIKGAGTRMGDALLAAMKTYEGTTAPAYMLSIYTLLGDPAMKVR